MDLERLVNRHKDAVYRQMVRVCGNHADAEDALADALLAAVRASSQLSNPDSFQAWLVKIGSRACARSRIRGRIEQHRSLTDLEALGIELADEDPDPSTQLESKTMKSCVSEAIERLPRIYREVYERREINGETAEHVAARLHLTVPAVKSRLHRARRLVRELLDDGFGCADLAA